MVTHAWVESPLQAVGAVEAFAAGEFGGRAVVHGRAGLEPVRRTMTELQRLLGPAGGAAGLTLRPESRGVAAQARTLALGDSLGGRSQRILLRPWVRDLVLLDDGRATRVVLRCLVDDAPLLRPQVAAGRARVALARAATRIIRQRARAGRVTVFTALRLEDELVREAAGLGVRLVRHDFPWLRSRPLPEPVESRVIVLGSALVANDLVRAEPYLDWVRGLAGAGGTVTYYAHRREDGRTLEPLTDHPRIAVRRGDLPVELRLRGLSDEHRVHTLPSTAAHTLGLVVPRVRIVEHPIPAGWWRPDAGPDVRDHLAARSATLAGVDSGDTGSGNSVNSVLGRPS